MGGNTEAFAQDGAQVAPRAASLIALGDRAQVVAAVFVWFLENRQFDPRGLIAVLSVDVVNRAGERSGELHPLAGALPTSERFWFRPRDKGGGASVAEPRRGKEQIIHILHPPGLDSSMVAEWGGVRSLGGRVAPPRFVGFLVLGGVRGRRSWVRPPLFFGLPVMGGVRKRRGWVAPLRFVGLSGRGGARGRGGWLGLLRFVGLPMLDVHLSQNICAVDKQEAEWVKYVAVRKKRQKGENVFAYAASGVNRCGSRANCFSP